MWGRVRDVMCIDRTKEEKKEKKGKDCWGVCNWIACL